LFLAEKTGITRVVGRSGRGDKGKDRKGQGGRKMLTQAHDDLQGTIWLSSLVSLSRTDRGHA
jgi:hypothetical protein